MLYTPPSRTYTKVFKDKDVLEEMLSFCREGFGASSVARAYNSDHTSILYQCKRAGVKIVPVNLQIRDRLPVPMTVEITPRSTTPKKRALSQQQFIATLDKDWLTDESGGRVSRGKKYKEIRREAQARRAHIRFTPPVSAFKDPTTRWHSLNLVV